MKKITIISEIGINWGGDMKLLKEMIFQGKDCGCDIIKTQLYDPAKLFPSKEIWVGNKNWYPEVEKTKMTKEQLFQFAKWCREVGAEPMASAFDLERLSWLEEIGVKRHKIATIFNKNKEYIMAVVMTNKEVLLSCQRRQLAYIPPLVGYKRIKVLYCIPEYPTQLSSFGFDKISFPYEFQGFSCHYPGIEPSIIAIARGAKIIEVHFTLSREMIGPDHTSSLEPSELKQLVSFARKTEEIW